MNARREVGDVTTTTPPPRLQPEHAALGAALELQIGTGAGAVPRARRAVLDTLADAPAELTDDVALVLTELLTNAVLHGTAPVSLRLDVRENGVRLEVADASAELPVLPQHSTEAMTGRGLALVARLAAAWGVAPGRTGGKVIWAELSAGGQSSTDVSPDFGPELDELLDAFPDEAAEPTYRVELGSVPTDMLLSAKAHIDNLVREFTFEASADRAHTIPSPRTGEHLPPDLAELVTTVVHGFSAARSAIKRQALAAAARGEQEVRLSLCLPASAADAGEQYLAALDEADRYARNARLLTLETPPVHRVFHRWYVGAIVNAVRAAAAGAVPPAMTTFTHELEQALTRTAPLEEQAARLQALQQVTAELTAAVTVDDIATTVVRSAATALGAHNAMLYLLGDDDHLHATAAEGDVNPRWLEDYARLPVTPDLPVGVALLSGQPVSLRGRDEVVQRFPALAEVYVHELSLLIAPLSIGDCQLGVLSLTFSGHARVEEIAQRSFVSTLADVAAQALERAKASAAAAEANERLRFLAQASLVLSSTLEYRSVLEAIAQLVVPRVADWCVISLLEDGQLQPAALAHADPAKVEWAKALSAQYPTDMSAETGAPNVVRTGVGELYADIPDELLALGAIDEEHLRLLRGVGMSSALIVPLTGRTGTLGTVTMISAEGGRRYDAADLAFAEDLARRAALAVENAHTYREQSGRLATVTRVAEAAQQAILAAPPARTGPVDLAARYVSAAAEALVGGDLYEVVRRPGAVRLLVGDVRGKGLGAIRTATIALGEFRSSAADLDDLGDVARQLDRRLRGYFGDEDFVTAVLAEIRDDGSFSVACCGHPAPLLARDGVVRSVGVSPTVPLGLGSAPTLTTGRLLPGDRLLLHTDGLVEARQPDGCFIDPLDMVGGLGDGTLDAALDAVLSRLARAVGDELGDDLALLAAEYRP